MKKTYEVAEVDLYDTDHTLDFMAQPGCKTWVETLGKCVKDVLGKDLVICLSGTSVVTTLYFFAVNHSWGDHNLIVLAAQNPREIHLPAVICVGEPCEIVLRSMHDCLALITGIRCIVADLPLLSPSSSSQHYLVQPVPGLDPVGMGAALPNFKKH